MKNFLFLSLLIIVPCHGSDNFEIVSCTQKNNAQTTPLYPPQIFRVTKSFILPSIEKPSYIKLITPDGYETGYYYFNRNSSTLLIVGPGILNKADQLLWAAHMFTDYDVAVMDFRCNYDILSFILSTDTLKNPKKAMIYDVAKDVTTVIKHVAKPTHTKIVGYGYCYGGWIFSLFQTSEKASRLFDYLILDSLPSSLDLLLNNILKDHHLMAPRSNDQYTLLEKVTRFPLLRKPLTHVLTKAFTNFSIVPTLADVRIPVLFIQGKKDRVASLNHFYTNFSACASLEKYALLTPHEHVENFRKSPNICTGVATQWIEGTLTDSLK